MDRTPLTKFFHWVYQKFLYLDIFSEVVANSKKTRFDYLPTAFQSFCAKIIPLKVFITFDETGEKSLTLYFHGVVHA